MAKKTPAKKSPSSSQKNPGPMLNEQGGEIKIYDPATIPEAQQVKFVWAEASTLADNPANWRLHPERQMQSLDALMKSVGWAGVLLYNRRSDPAFGDQQFKGKLCDGHARKKLKRNGPVPVLIGDWSPAQEAQILTSLDPIAAMAETDTQKLRELLNEVEGEFEKIEEKAGKESLAAIEELHETLHSQAEYIDMGAPSAFLPSPQDFDDFTRKEKEKIENSDEVDLTQASTITKGIASLKSRFEILPDEWGPRGPYGIPYLRPDRLAPAPEKLATWFGPETPVDDDTQYFLPWGVASVRKCKLDGLIVAFYVVDEKFESVWNAPEDFCAKMLNSGVKYVVMPNYSCCNGDDLAFDIFQTYRNNWLARYFQEAGLYVIPDLMLGNLSNHNGECWKYRFAAIPKNAPCVAVQLQQKGRLDAGEAYTEGKKVLLEALRLLTPKALIAYVPPDLPANFFKGIPKGIRVIETPTFMSLRSKMLKERQKEGEYLRG